MMNQLHHPQRCINRLIHSALNSSPQLAAVGETRARHKSQGLRLGGQRFAVSMPKRWVNISKSHPHYYFAMKHRFDIISEQLKYDPHCLKYQMDNDDAAHSLAERFVKLSKDSQHFDLEDKNLRPLIGDIVRHISELSPLMLAEVLHAVTVWKRVHLEIEGGNFDLLWNALDKELASRLNYEVDLLNKFNVNETFKVSNMFVISNPGVISKYNYKLRKLLLSSADEIINKCDTMNKDILINTLFLVRISQIKLTINEQQFLEEKVNMLISLMTIDEIGVICSTFNSKYVTKKFNSVLRDRLYDKIMKLTKGGSTNVVTDEEPFEDIKTDAKEDASLASDPNVIIPESYRRLNSVPKSVNKSKVTMNAMIKLLQSVTYHNDEADVTMVTDWILQNLSKLKSLGVINLKHLILLKNNINLYIPEIFDAAIESMLEAPTLDPPRSREISTILSFAAKFGHEVDTSKVKSLLELFQRSSDTYKDAPFVLLGITTAAGHYNVYDDHFIRSSLDAEALATSYSRFLRKNIKDEVHYLLLQLHSMVSIEANKRSDASNSTIITSGVDTIEPNDGKGVNFGVYDPILLSLYEIQQYRAAIMDSIPINDDYNKLMNKLKYCLQVIHGTGHGVNGQIPSVAIKQLLPYTFNPSFVVYNTKDVDEIDAVNNILDNFNVSYNAINKKASVYLILHPFHYTSTGSLTGVIKLRKRLLSSLGFKNVITIDLCDLETKTVPQIVIELKKKSM